MPAVTVVIPAFNAEPYIGDALASVRDQTLTDLEVILVDDGSTDGTIAEAKRSAGSLDLTIVCQKNAGPSAARNAGIRRARGRHCAFLDADDTMLPELLAAQAELLDADPEVGLVLTDVMTFDERGTIHASRWSLSDPVAGSVLDRLLLDNFITTSAVMAPTKYLCEAGLFPEDRRVAEDYELWLRLASRWKVALIDRPLVRYRYSSGSLSSDRLFSARCALEVIEAFWREHPDYLAAHPEVASRSLGGHLANAGSAAAAQGKTGPALGYLVRSLRHDPLAAVTWKRLAKALAVPFRGFKGARPSPARVV
jgi:glycosyltransferase involved in cell wall biosynthesis